MDKLLQHYHNYAMVSLLEFCIKFCFHLYLQKEICLIVSNYNPFQRQLFYKHLNFYKTNCHFEFLIQKFKKYIQIAPCMRAN